MFDHIIVAEEILPIRQAAGEGDIEAMFKLADQVIRGKLAKPCGKTAREMINRMYWHQDFTENPHRASIGVFTCWGSAWNGFGKTKRS